MSVRLFIFCVCLTLPSAVLIAENASAVHTVQKGETVYAIAKIYKISVDELLSYNAIANADKILAGQKLRIPELRNTAGTEARGTSAAGGAKPAAAKLQHTVKKGETLFGIARQYGVSVDAVLQANNLTAKSVIIAGKSLTIPQKGAAGSGGQVAGTGKPAAAAQTAGVAQASLGSRTTPFTQKWPVKAKEVHYMKNKLTGVALLGEKSEPVLNFSQGVVVSAGPYRGFGRVVIVQSQTDYLYVYGGLEKISVKSGDKVTPGLKLGELGIEAQTEKPQLLFLVYHNNVPIDPAKAPRI